MDKELLLVKLKELNQALSDVHDVLTRMDYFMDVISKRE